MKNVDYKRRAELHKQAITIKFHGPTVHRGDRIGIKDERFGQRREIPYDYEYSDVIDQAMDYLTMLGYNINSYSSNLDNQYIILVDNFQPLLEMQEKKTK